VLWSVKQAFRDWEPFRSLHFGDCVLVRERDSFTFDILVNLKTVLKLELALGKGSASFDRFVLLSFLLS
jgi:hypothetical protein